MNIFKFCILLSSFYLSHEAIAELQCSKKGTKIFYVNGINVEFGDASETAKSIDTVLGPYQIQIDKTKYIQTESVHNISTGFISDMRETKSMLIGNRNGEGREEFHETILRGEFGLPLVRMESLFKTAQEKAYEKTREALRQHLKRYRIQKKEDYLRLASIKNESDLLQSLGRITLEEARLAKTAAADILVVNKVIYKIVDALKNDYKVLFVAHSQGNEVLRSAVRELQRQPIGEGRFSSMEEYNRTINKVLGTLQVAPPSSNLIFCGDVDSPDCKSQKILLDDDIVIGNGNFVMSYLMRALDYETPAVAPNYVLYSDLSSKIFDFLMLDSNPFSFITKKLLFLKKTSGIHGMDDVYLSDTFKATPIGGGSELPMSQIFRERAIAIAKTLENNCDRKCSEQAFTLFFQGHENSEKDAALFSCGSERNCEEIKLSIDMCEIGEECGQIIGNYFQSPDKSKAMFVDRTAIRDTPKLINLKVCQEDDPSYPFKVGSYVHVNGNSILNSAVDSQGNTLWTIPYFQNH